MKRVFLALGVVFCALTATQAQEKGLHLTLGGGLGQTTFIHDLKGSNDRNDGGYRGGLGYGGYLGVQYFFTRHVGISLGGEFFVFNTQSRYNKNQSFLFDGQVDDEMDTCRLDIGLRNWKENQQTNFVEIPLMFVYQHKFGSQERHGIYFGLGAKAQIPISSSYKRYDGDVKVWGYYPQWGLPLGEDGTGVEIPWHAYGTNTERGWDGSNDLKIGVAAVAEFGFLFGLSPRVDLTLGVSADYGFLNIKDRNDNLLGPVAGKTQQEQTGEVKPAMNDFYIGVLNSNRIEHINPMSIRGKVGLRIKIGKLKVKDTITETERRGGRTTGIGNDTIFVSPVIVYLPAQIPEQAGDGNGDPNGTNSGTSPSRNAYTQDTEPLPQEIEDELEESIYFDLDKSFLRPESKEVLDRKVELMKKYPQAVLSVVGHTCNLGTEGHNDRLSYDRAEEARMYLIEKGVHPSRIVPIPRGMKNPKYKNIDESNRALNRRVDFLIAR